MKLWKLVLLIFLTNSASAFFIDSHLVVTEKQVHISVEEGRARVEIVTEIQNPTETEIIFQELLPLEKGGTVENFFLNMEGRGYSLIEGKERLMYLFEKAKEYQSATFLEWGSDQYAQLFRSENLAVESQQKVRTKNVFNIPIKTQDDFEFLELFLGTSNSSVPTEITFLLPERPAYFLHSLGDGALVDRGERTTLLWTGDNIETVSFHWSDVSNAEMSVPFLGMEYRSHFVPPVPKDIQEVTILVDRSGSLTGLPWQRTKDWVEFLLETFGEEMNIRIGFFAEDMAWHDEGFQANSFDFQKDFFGFLSGVAPVGKTDIGKIFNLQSLDFARDRSSIFKKSEIQNHVVIVITDQEELEEEIFAREMNDPFIVLQFSENEENDLELFSRLSGGFTIKLFRSASSLVEKDEFLEKLENLNTNIVQQQELEMSEILPKFFPPQMRSEPFFFTGRVLESSQRENVSAGHFVSRGWGALKIAEILESFLLFNPGVENKYSLSAKGKLEINPGVEVEKFDALLAIGRTFGVSTKFFDEKTTREALEENLHNVSKKELIREIMRLQFSIFDFRFSNEEVKFLNGVPLYFVSNPGVENEYSLSNKEEGKSNPGVGDGIWQQFNFPELVRGETLISIAPFSEAQKQLFLQFPEFVAEGFGMGREVDFCTPLRCISIRDEEREESLPADRAFFKDYDVAHWAHAYIVRAVGEGLLKPELNGKLHPNRPIDRGEFAKMVKQSSIFNLQSSKTDISLEFSDLNKEDEYFDAVQVLVERGVVKGYGDGTFRPLQSLTRAEGVKILLAISGYVSKDAPDTYPEIPFSDVVGWEKPWVEEAVRRGMVRGYGDGTFRPHGKLTRAEALKIMFEMGE
jgi:hypothetical protein